MIKQICMLEREREKEREGGRKETTNDLKTIKSKVELRKLLKIELFVHLENLGFLKIYYRAILVPLFFL